MNQAANWSPSQVPTNGDLLIFPTSVTLSKSVLNNIGPLTIGNLTIADAYTLVGSAFVVPSGTTTLTYGSSGSNINLGGLTLNGTLQVSSNAGGNTITSLISGSGGLTLQGGLLTLAGTNSYSGATTLGTGATLKALTTAAFGNLSNVTIGSGSVLDLNSFNNTIGTLNGGSGSAISLGTATLIVTNSGTINFQGTITGTNAGFALGATSTGTLTLSGNNSYSSQAAPGTTTVSGGTLRAGSANAFGSHSNLSIASGATLNLNNFTGTFGTLTGAGTLTLGTATASFTAGGTFTGDVGGTGGGITAAGGTLTLSGTNSYTGLTTLQGGATLVLNTLGSTSGLTFSSGGGTLQLANALTSSVPIILNDVGTISNANAVTLNGAISGAGAFSKTGAGVLTLGGANGYTGATNVKVGTLQAGSTTAFGSNSAVTVFEGATLDLNSNSLSIQSLAGDTGSFVTLGSGSLTISGANANTPFYGVVSGTGNVLITGGTQNFMGTNTYNGTTTIQSGVTLNTVNLGSTTSLIFGTGGGAIEFGSATSSSASIVTNGAATFGTNTFNVTLSGGISNSGSPNPLTKIGLGTLTLTGANSNASSITIKGGTLNLIPASLGSTTAIVFDIFGGTLQAGADLTITQPITLSNYGTIDTNGHAVIVNAPITGGNPFTKMGAGTLTFGGGNNYAAKTTIQQGTLITPASSYPSGSQLVFASSGGTFQITSAFPTFTSSIVLMANGTIDTNGNNMTASGVVAGLSTNSFTKTGAGTLIFSGANIYTGPTNVNVGTLQAGVASTSTSGAFGVGSAVTIASGATLALNNFNNTIGSLAGPSGSLVTLGTGVLTISNGNSQNFAGDISGTGGGLALTAGSLTLSGTNSYTGPTSVNGGTLTAGSTSAFGSGSAVSVAASATLALNSFNNTIGSLSGPAGSFVTLGSATLRISSGSGQTFAGVISGTGGIRLDAGTLTLSGSNSYSGATNVAGGTLQAGSTSAYGNNSAVTVASGGTLALNSFNNTVASLTGASGGAVTLGSATLTIANGGGLTYAGNVSGTGGLALTTGTLTLSGTNAFGSATVNGGTLNAGSTGALTSSNITIANGATLAFQTFANTVGTISNTGSMSSSAAINATSYAQHSTLTLDFPTSSATPFGSITTTGAISLDGALVVTNTGGYSAPSGTEITLMHSSGLGQQLTGTFSSVNLAFGTLHYDYADNNVILSLGGCDGNWINPASQNWGNTANWSSGCAPGISGVAADQDTATFGQLGASSIAVTLANSAGSSAVSVTLHDIIFDTTTTSYTIEQFSGSGAIILDGQIGNSKPRITAGGGSSRINAPITLNKDSRVTLAAGTLTFGDSCTVTGASNALFISEGATSGSFVNNGTISPQTVNFEGGSISNFNNITPTGAISIAAVSGNASPLNITNIDQMTAGTNMTIDGSGGTTIVNNQGTLSAAQNVTITAGTLANSQHGRVFAGSGNTLTVSGGTVTNDTAATFGSSNANLLFSGGSLTTDGAVVANNYTQSGSSNLQVNVSNPASGGSVTANGTATLGGALTVNARSDFSLTGAQQITLLSAEDGLNATKFSSISYQNFPNSFIPNLLYLPNSVVLDARPAVPSHFTATETQIVFSAVGQHNTFIARKCNQVWARNRQSAASANTAMDYEPYDGLRAENDAVVDSYGNTVSQAEFQVPEKQAQLADRIREEERPWNIYFGPLATFGKVDTQGDQVGLSHTSAGGLIGFDGIVASSEEAWFNDGLGAVVEYRREWGDVLENAGSLTIDRVHGSIYNTLIPTGAPNLSVNTVLGFAYTWDRFSRNAGIGGVDIAKGSTNEAIFDALFGLEYAFSKNNFSFIPLVYLQYVHDRIGSYTESGAGIYDLHVDSQTVQSLCTLLGGRLDYTARAKSFSTRFEIFSFWQREYFNNSRTVNFTPFNITATPIGINTVAAARNSGLIGIDIFTTTKGGWTIEANANAQWGKAFYDAFFYFGLGKLF
jgi:fibronectin-binding autotransporter adhesin